LRAPDLARRWEVAVRTAYRDLEFLRNEWNAPVEYDRSRRTYVLTQPTFAFPSVDLSEGELLALFFAEKVVAQYRGTPYGEELSKAIGKLARLLPDEVRISPGPLDTFLSLDLGPVAAPDGRVFSAVVEALCRRRRLSIRYRSHASGRTLDRTIEPYRVFNHRGDWYVAAWDHRRGEVRDFALHRIRRVVPLDETYEIDPGFRFERYSADAFGIEKGDRPVEVRIRFAPRQARWIREKRWHRTARVQDDMDGGCTLALKVTGLGEVKRWVMQFGDEAEVLAPRSLRDEVRRQLARALKRYRATASPRSRDADRPSPEESDADSGCQGRRDKPELSPRCRP
jgi:predicted DNA-binding transcriptional regulator YafY